MSDDFSNYPKSIAEVRSDKSRRPRDWTPRDMLIYLLREIDEGRLKPNRMAIVGSYIDQDGATSTSTYFAGTLNALENHGMFAEAMSISTEM